jgi:predicted nuclease with TOPRIM domain
VTISLFFCRYCELRADYDRAQDKIRELEKETESLRKSMEEQEERHKSMYLKMYMKGQEAAKFEHADQVRGQVHVYEGKGSSLF